MIEFTPSLKELFATLHNRGLGGVSEVIVHVGADVFVLPDTVVLLLDNSLLQLTTEVHAKHWARLANTDSLVVSGDYADRTGVSLRPMSDFAPFRVGDMFAVWNDGLTERVLVGFFLADETGNLAFGVNAHLDDLICGPPERMWNYLSAILPSHGRLVIERV